MFIDLLKTTTEKLGYQPLQPVSSTSLEVTGNTNRVAQAIIPSVLVGFLNLTDTDEGLDAIAKYKGEDWPTILFNNNKSEALQSISKYSALNEEQLVPEINKTANTAIEIIKDAVKNHPDKSTTIKSYLKNQRNIILNHLPASLKMGSLLKNEGMDDHTTKMQGPFSTVMHKITESFDKNETDEKLDKKSRNF